MIAIINGTEGATLKSFKGGFDLLRLILLSDGTVGPTGQVAAVGSPLDVTGDTVTLEVYDTVDRRNAAVKSLPATIVGATYGYLTVALTATLMDFGPGTYYVYAKRSENTGATIEFSRVHSVMQVS